MFVGLHVPTKFQKYRQNSKKKKRQVIERFEHVTYTVKLLS